MTTASDPRLLAVVADARWGVLTTIKRDGRPQLSNVGYAYDRAAGVVRISVTADRAKTRNLRADPRVTLHVASKDFWTWVAVEGTAELTPVAADPHDATVEELIAEIAGLGGRVARGCHERATTGFDRSRPRQACAAIGMPEVKGGL